MWPKGFDPEHLTQDASLNKLVIRGAPGAQPDHVGENGGDLLGRDAVVTLVRQRCGVDVPPDAVADWFGAAMAVDPSAGTAATVADEVGDRLASLIATLRDPASGAAATGGRRTHLEVWQSLDLVILGGGLMKGVLGQRVAARTDAVLAAAGVDPPAVRVARHPEWLSLLGAARSAPGCDAHVVVLDGGQTSIKRGMARIQDRELASLQVFPPVSVRTIAALGLSAAVDLAVTSLPDQHRGTAPEVMFSVAAYLCNGRPIRYGSSIYEQLEPAPMQARLGLPVRMIHDGSAAWRGIGTGARSAVIMLGTWLGVGIGPHREPLRPYSDHFALHSLPIGAP